MYSVQKQLVVYLQPILTASKKAHVFGACKKSNQEICIENVKSEVRMIHLDLNLTKAQKKNPAERPGHTVKFFLPPSSQKLGILGNRVLCHYNKIFGLAIRFSAKSKKSLITTQLFLVKKNTGNNFDIKET